MKYSVAAVSAFAAVALAKPEFLNSSFQVVENTPFVLEYSGCEGGCTLTLQTGPSTDLKDVEVLTSSATGSSTTVTLKGIPSGIYSFKITDANNDSNFSEQFPLQGSAVIATSATSSSESKTTGAATKTAASSTSNDSTTVATSTSPSTSASTSPSTEQATTAPASLFHTISSNSTSVAPTGSPSTTGGHSITPAASSSKPAMSTTPPGNAAGSLSSPLALVAGVALAIAFFS